MTRPTTASEIEKLLDRLKSASARWRAATSAQDVPKANRQVVAAWRAIEALVTTKHGRDEIERMLVDPLPDIRLQAAVAALDWAPYRAVPVLGRLLFEDLGQASVDERIDIRLNARERLLEHFGISDPDRNKLIEPLRAYGIELPYLDHEAWQ